MHLEFGITVGSLDAASGPAACRFFLRPTRVVGGGGSYFGFSFCVGIEDNVSKKVRGRGMKLHKHVFGLIPFGPSHLYFGRRRVGLRPCQTAHFPIHKRYVNVGGASTGRRGRSTISSYGPCYLYATVC